MSAISKRSSRTASVASRYKVESLTNSPSVPVPSCRRVMSVSAPCRTRAMLAWFASYNFV